MARSIDFWHAVVTGEVELLDVESRLLTSLKEEVPTMISTTMERSCNLQCAHCIYQEELATAITKDHFNIRAILQNLVVQLPRHDDAPHFIAPRLLHDGRILRNWHLSVLEMVREMRSDVLIGLIDNGSYSRLLPKWKEFEFDWIDISVDGLRETHNLQRQSPKAFDIAMNGLSKARSVVKPSEHGGKVTSLLTLTSINKSEVFAVANLLLPDFKVDELHVTPVSPARHQIEMLIDEFGDAWSDIVKATQVFGQDRFYFRIYRIEDLQKLCQTVGKSAFREAFDKVEVAPATASMVLEIEGVKVHYFPLSIWPQETFLVDADGSYRTAYSAQHTLAELQSGMSVSGEDTTLYTVAKLGEESSLEDLYHKCVQQWWSFLGRKNLLKERGVLSQLLSPHNAPPERR